MSEPLPKKLVVKVTWEDIDKGKKGSFACCPIALAVKRSLGMTTGVYVDKRGRIQVITGGDGGYNTYTPTWGYLGAVRGFIDQFDKGGRVRPFTPRLSMD